MIKFILLFLCLTKFNYGFIKKNKSKIFVNNLFLKKKKSNAVKNFNNYNNLNNNYEEINKNVKEDLYVGKNKNQKEYIKYLNNEKIKLICSIGSAGTGKTLFACQKAINDLKNKKISKIIITRPIINGIDEIGFLPGTLNKKMEPWTKPIFDIFKDYYTQLELDRLISDDKIEICPLIFMRGRTFKNSFIIADEMQNSNINQMKMLLTRIGVNSRLVITGDLEQKDNLKFNGLDDFLTKFNDYNIIKNQSSKKKVNDIKIIYFSNNDVERSDIVKNILSIYNLNNLTDHIKINDKYINESQILKNEIQSNLKKNINVTIIEKDIKNSDISINKFEKNNFVNNNLQNKNDAALIKIDDLNKLLNSKFYKDFTR